MFKPLLALSESVKFEQVKLPVIASPKIDGIRAVVINGELLSRSLKPIPNHNMRAALSNPRFNNIDGELVTYTNGAIDDFNTIQSKVMGRNGSYDFKLLAFDYFEQPQAAYTVRLAQLQAYGCDLINILDNQLITSSAELAAYEESAVAAGHEGVMLRKLTGHYKFGRSTLKEHILLKLKRFDDDEALIIGVVEQLANNNEATRDALGNLKRSSSIAGKTGKGLLGALTCQWRGVEFDLGTGFDDAQRAELWERRDSIIGDMVTFKYQGVGSLGRPRFPVFKSIREMI